VLHLYVIIIIVFVSCANYITDTYVHIKNQQNRKNKNFRESQLNINENLSYRQQIAHQLRTQYAEGIYRHKYYTVTLKSRLIVTQGHWKRDHWIDHT